MNPELPDGGKVLDNPYQYTDYQSDATHGARGTIFGEPGLRVRGVAAPWQDVARDPTSSSRWRAGSTCSRASTRDHRAHVAGRGRGGRRPGPADRAPAAADARGARLRPLATTAPSQLTPKVLTLGMAYVASLGLWDVARPHLEALVGRTGESSSMAQLDGSDIVYVARVSVPKIIALRVDIGTRFPAAADLPGQGPARRPARPTSWTPSSRSQPVRAARRTSADRARSCARSSPQVRARGWALADEELAPGVRSVAVPVRDGTGAVRAAMNVTVHAAETSTERLLDHHLPLLLRTAGDVSADWALWQSRPHVEVDSVNDHDSAAGR